MVHLLAVTTIREKHRFRTRSIEYLLKGVEYRSIVREYRVLDLVELHEDISNGHLRVGQS